MTEQWQELKETIIELRDNDGTGTQQEVCKFLANLMDVLEKQMQEPKTGHWIKSKDGYMRCDQCGSRGSAIKARFCHHCGAKM